MKRKLFALFFALAASIGLSWGTEVTSPTAITWDESVISSIELYEVNDSFTNSGITIQMTERQFGGGFYLSKFSTGGQATFVFSSTVGDITGITINAGSVQLNFTGWGGDQTTATWSGTPSSSVTASATPFIDIDQISSIVFTIEPAAAPEPQRYTTPVKAEDLIVGDTLAQGALLSTQRYEGFWFATGRARYHGQVVTRDYLCSFERLGAVSKHGAIDSEAMGYRGCFEPINENGQLGEEWVVTSVSPFTIAGIGTAVITNTNYTSAVDYAVIEPGDTLSEGALIQNGPTIYWMLQDRVYYNDIPRDESDTYLERYHTFGQNGVFEDGGGIIKPRNEQGEEGSKWLVVYYSPLTLAGIGAPSMTLTLAENVSIVGLPIDGITDKGNGVYEVVKGTVFSVQVAEPEHYTFDHWSDLGSADPQYSANPRTITMTGNMNLTPVYNIDTYSLTLGVNDPARGSVKIAPVMKKIIWDEAYLRTVIALASNYMPGPSTYDYVNNIKDGIMMDPQAYYSEVYFRYVPELGYSALYLRATSNVYDAGLNFSKRKEAVFDKFQLVEIYTPEANHNIISENYAPWSYNTSKGCYQIEQFGTWGHVEIVEAFGGELNMRIDSVIFYAPSDLPQGVTPTETPGVYTVEWGSEISFVATPASEDYYLAKWNDEPAASDTLTLTITGEQTVSAYFAHVPYIITLPESVSILGLPIEGITDNGDGTYTIVEGTEFQVQATASEHQQFDHWGDLGSDDPQYAANPRTITMTGNMNLTPVYNIDTYSLTIGVDDPARGSVKIAPTTRKVVWSKEHLQTIYEWKYNNPRAVAWEEHRNNEKDGISINATPIASEVGLMSDSYYDFKPLMFFYDVNASITFNSNIYTFNSIEIYGEYTANFNGWTYNTAKGCYQVSGLGNTVSLTPTEGAEIYQFVDSIIFYANIALPQGVTPTETPGVYTVEWGSEISFVATPASEDYYLAKWNDQPATNDTLTLTITGEQTVSAYFAHAPYIITLPESVSILGLPIEGITDNGDGTYTIVEGTEFQVQATASEHQQFDYWGDLGSDDPQYAANPRTITMTGSLNLNPVYSLEKFTLTLATNDSTKGVVKVLGGVAGVRETIILKNKGAEDPIQGEYFQVSGGGTDNFGRYIGQTKGYSLTISSLNGEMIDSISFSVTATSMWSGYTVSSTSGEVVDNVFGNYTFKVKNINATSVTISRSGDGDPSGSITVDVVYVNQDLPIRAEISDMEFPTSGNTLTINDMTLTVGSFDLNTPKITGGGTFTTDLGEFTAISIYSYGFDGFAGEGWTGDMYTRRWTGQSSSVSFDGMVFGDGIGSITITYTIVPAPAATGGIVDNGDGTYTVDWGTELTFVAQPAEDHHLVSWNGEPATSDTLRLTMEGELSVSATFAHDPYVYTLPETVSMVEPLPAGVTDKGNGVYEIEPGTEFQVSANIPEHYHIAGWADLDAEDAAYLANPRTLTADSTMTLEPIFAIDTYTLTLATNDSTKGVVSVEGAGAGVDIVWDANFWNGIQAYMNGEDIVHANNSKDGITITFDGGDFENGLKDGQIKLDNSDNKLIFTSTVGEFTKIFLKGYVPGNAPEGWDRVAGLTWEVTPSATVELPGSAALVEFEEAVFTLTSAASGIVDNGDGTYTVDWGTELTFVAQPAEGFMLESWSNGAEVTGDTLKLTMTEELSLTANFKYIPAVITLPDGVNIVEPVPAGITDNGDGTYTVEHGTEFQVSVDSIPAHYHFTNWADLDAEDEQYAANPRTIVAGEDLTVEPFYAIDTYVISLASNDETMGTLRIAGAGEEGEEPEGKPVSVTIGDPTSAEAKSEIPCYSIMKYTYSQQIYTAKEIGGAGEITAITYWLKNSSEYTRTCEIYMKEVSESAFASNTSWVLLAESDKVASYELTNGIDAPVAQTITLNTPFEYSGKGNLLIAFNDVTGQESSGVAGLVNDVTGTKALFSFRDNTAYDVTNPSSNGILDTKRNVVKIDMIAAPSTLPEGIVDNGDGTYTVDYGTELTFVAQPAEGFMLESWSNGAEVTGDTLKLTMTEELSLTANFKYIPAVITLPDGVNIVEPVPAGITDNGDGTYTVEHGTEFQVSVDSIPAHYHFDHWADLDAEDEQYAANPRTIVADSALTLEPIFAIDTHTLTLATNDSTKGVVILEGAGKGGEPEGKTIEWDSAFMDGVIAYMSGSGALHSNNTKDGITVTYEGASMGDGMQNGLIHLDSNDKLVFTSTVGDIAKIEIYGTLPNIAPENWTIGEALTWEGTPAAVVELPADVHVTQFVKTVFTLVPAASGIVDNGDGTYTVEWGTELTFIAQPAENYHLDSWWNGGFAETGDTLKITLEGDTTVNAYFKHDTYILSVEGTEIETAKFYDGTDSVVVLKPGTLIGVVEGDSVLLTTTANYSSANIGEYLTITVHYDIKVVSTQDDYEYALAITDSIYPLKGFIIEPMVPDTTAEPESEETEVREGIEVYGYGYCADGNMTGMRYHLKQGNPNQYKIEYEDSLFTDVPWTDLEVTGPDGVIYVKVPVDAPTGDYKMTVTFRDSTEFYIMESAPVTITFHVNLPETYVVVLFNNVIAVVDTCNCLTDIQWYHRANSTDEWTAIPGATGYYYKQEGGLSGEYFIKAKMNGVDTYTCPQEDVTTLYGGDKQAEVSVYPNPVESDAKITIENSTSYEHDVRIVNYMGLEVQRTSFEGNSTTIDMSSYMIGNYLITVDGITVKVMKK